MREEREIEAIVGQKEQELVTVEKIRKFVLKRTLMVCLNSCLVRRSV